MYKTIFTEFLFVVLGMFCWVLVCSLYNEETQVEKEKISRYVNNGESFSVVELPAVSRFRMGKGLY